MISERMWKKAEHWFRMENDKCPPLQRARYYLTLESQGLDTAAMEEAA